jgi:hypothetical protein
LKRDIERLVVQPMSNLIATDQIRRGDWLRIDFDASAGKICFFKDAEGLPMQAMAELLDQSLLNLSHALTQAATAEPPKTSAAKSSRRS